MLILIIFIALCFAFSAFLANLSVSAGHNPFLSFLFYQGDFVINHLLFFTIFFIVAVAVLLRVIQFEKTHKLHQKAAVSVVHIVSVFFIGIFLSYVLLLFIAWLQLNIYAVIVNSNPGMLGIISDQKTIVTTLKNSNEPPQIIASDEDSSKELVAIAAATTGQDSFYGSSVLATVPSFLVIPIKHLAPSLLVDNTLIITEINRTDLQILSPIVGYMFIKHYFPLRRIKFYPKISIMDENEYKAFRAKDAKERIVSLDTQIATIEDLISSTSASLQKDKESITFDQNLVKDSFAKKDDQMKKCFAQGYYQGETFIHTTTQDDCKNQASEFDATIDKANKEIDDLTQKIPTNEDQLTLYKNYDVFFKNQKKLSEVLTKNVPHELGVFKPKDTIRIVIDTKNSHAIADYFATVAHEYFHYASYNEKQSLSSLFFEEGFTEYFARQAIEDNLNTSTNLGYPVFVKIIRQITKRIAETDLADIYFTKDEAKLESTLDKVYGDGFYKNNILLFTTLQYASDPKQVLTTANTIMKHIGGTPLTQKDLFSTLSAF